MAVNAAGAVVHVAALSFRRGSPTAATTCKGNGGQRNGGKRQQYKE